MPAQYGTPASYKNQDLQHFVREQSGFAPYSVATGAPLYAVKAELGQLCLCAADDPAAKPLWS